MLTQNFFHFNLGLQCFSRFRDLAFSISSWHEEECLFPPWENDTTEDFFFSSGRSVSEGSLYPPRVVFTHERSEGCNWDPRGVKMPEDTLLSEEKKKSKVVSFFTWRMWLSSILEVIPTSSECLILKQPLQPQTASNSLKTASKVFFCLI